MQPVGPSCPVGPCGAVKLGGPIGPWDPIDPYEPSGPFAPILQQRRAPKLLFIDILIYYTIIRITK
jgi:hypothetical protein